MSKMLNLFKGGKSAILAVTAALLLVAHGTALTANAASWEAINQEKFGDWETTYNRNRSTSDYFCSSESRGTQETIFRINFYKSKAGQFIEFFNPQWDLVEGPGQFVLRFDNGFDLEFSGKAYSDSYTYDLIENKKIELIFGLLSKGKKFELINANGAKVSSFSLNGAPSALEKLKSCINSSGVRP